MTEQEWDEYQKDRRYWVTSDFPILGSHNQPRPEEICHKEEKDFFKKSWATYRIATITCPHASVKWRPWSLPCVPFISKPSVVFWSAKFPNSRRNMDAIQPGFLLNFGAQNKKKKKRKVNRWSNFKFWPRLFSATFVQITPGKSWSFLLAFQLWVQ